MRSTYLRRGSTIASLVGICTLVLGVAGCDSTATKHEVKRVDNAAEQQKEQIEAQADQAQENVDQAAEQTKEAIRTNEEQRENAAEQKADNLRERADNLEERADKVENPPVPANTPQ